MKSGRKTRYREVVINKPPVGNGVDKQDAVRGMRWYLNRALSSGSLQSRVNIQDQAKSAGQVRG